MKFDKVSYRQYVEDRNIGNSLFVRQEYDSIISPTRATIGSAGYDFFLPFNITLKPKESIVIPTGIKWNCHNIAEQDFVLKVYPRSGLGFKYQLGLANTVGIIDSDYCNSDNEGHIQIKLVNRGDKTVELPQESAFAQGIISKYYACDNDTTTETRNSGFGSTNK